MPQVRPDMQSFVGPQPTPKSCPKYLDATHGAIDPAVHQACIACLNSSTNLTSLANVQVGQGSECNRDRMCYASAAYCIDRKCQPKVCAISARGMLAARDGGGFCPNCIGHIKRPVAINSALPKPSTCRVT